MNKYQNHIRKYFFYILLCVYSLVGDSDRQHGAQTESCLCRETVSRRMEEEGMLSLISLHVCHAVFLQGFLVSFSRHQWVQSQGLDTNGSVKGAYSLWLG